MFANRPLNVNGERFLYLEFDTRAKVPKWKTLDSVFFFFFICFSLLYWMNDRLLNHE